MDVIRPVLNEAALILEESVDKRHLIIADLHLGFELTLIEKGIEIPFQTQTERLVKRLSQIIERENPASLVILGDIKHTVPMISQMEWRVVPPFFEQFTELPIHIILGNHESDAQIEGLTPRNVIIHPAQGCIKKVSIGERELTIALLHGHTWPGIELFNADILIMAHNHPVIEFRDEFKVRTYERVWIRTHWNKIKLAKSYLNHCNIKKAKNPILTLREKFSITIKENPEIIIMPAFNDLLGGIPFNTNKSHFIGPLFKSQSLNLDSAEVILLDGTRLGKLEDLRDQD